MNREDIVIPADSQGVLPTWTSVLAVVAHPDDESFVLGAILAAFTRAGSKVEVLCLTHGEASTLRGVPDDLHSVRAGELDAAAEALGVARTTLLDYPDGALSGVKRIALEAVVVGAAETAQAEGLLVFDPSGVTGHLDHAVATAAALLAAETLNLPVLGWTLPRAVADRLNQELGAAFAGHPEEEIDLRVGVDRAPQQVAIQAHASQTVPGSVLWRRLELLGDTESLRWLRRTTEGAPVPAVPEVTDGADSRTIRVEHHGEDRFDIRVWGHGVSVEQPVADGGEAPTPTELVVVGLASCVAYSARRYLARQELPAEGLAVEATVDRGTEPERAAGIEVRLILPDGVPAGHRDALRAVAERCAVHAASATPPPVRITLALAGDG